MTGLLPKQPLPKVPWHLDRGVAGYRVPTVSGSRPYRGYVAEPGWLYREGDGRDLRGEAGHPAASSRHDFQCGRHLPVNGKTLSQSEDLIAGCPAHDDLGLRARVQTTLATFAVTAVNPSTLPNNFFDPASLGYRGVDAVMRTNLAQMPSTFPVYWLGMHWKGTSVLSPLAVSSADRSGPHRLDMSYAPEGNRFGDAVGHFLEANGGTGWPTPLPSGPCVSRQPIALSGGYGIIVSPRTGSGCTGGGALSAVAEFGKLKIAVDPVIRFAGPQQRARYRAYTTVPGLTAVLKASPTVPCPAITCG